jgi:GDP-mannose 6-dehydrogenase
VRISVFGAGYVGAVSAACLARDGHEVWAVDVDPKKVEQLAAGLSPIVEPGLDALIEAGVGEGRLSATMDAHEAIAATDLSYLCVGTPSRPNGSLNTAYVGRVAEHVGSALRGKNGFHSVVMRSTVLPGTTEELVAPKLEAGSGKKAGQGFGYAYYPEFLREGSAIADYDHPGTIIFGVADDQTRDDLLDLHKQFAVAPRLMSIRAAEAVKYVNNAWHAVKISFANEIGLISKALGVDGHDVMDALCADARLNMSPAYLKPGFAFGGSCLPKDLAALRYGARLADVETPVLDAAVKANRNQLDAAWRLVEATGKRCIGLIGLSFKPETDDLRYSPMVELAERLIGRGFEVKIYDPIIRLSRLTGANREYIKGRLPHISGLLLERGEELLAQSEVIVVGNRAEAAPLLGDGSRAGKIVIDLVRMDRKLRSGGDYHGVCW